MDPLITALRGLAAAMFDETTLVITLTAAVVYCVIYCTADPSVIPYLLIWPLRLTIVRCAGRAWLSMQPVLLGPATTEKNLRRLMRAQNLFDGIDDVSKRVREDLWQYAMRMDAAYRQQVIVSASKPEYVWCAVFRLSQNSDQREAVKAEEAVRKLLEKVSISEAAATTAASVTPGNTRKLEAQDPTRGAVRTAKRLLEERAFDLVADPASV